MDKNTVMFVIIAALAGFIAGFVLANKLNGSEMATLRAGVAQPAPPSNTAPAAPVGNRPEDTLSTEEIKAKIAEADKNPGNFSFQKDLGVALYKYGAMKQDESLLEEAVRILERARSI